MDKSKRERLQNAPMSKANNTKDLHTDFEPRYGHPDQLPEITIQGTIFIVDIDNWQLRERRNHSNVISFRDKDVKLVMDGFELLYDPIRKNVFNGAENERTSRPDLIPIKIPSRSKLDPVWWKEKYEPPGPYIEWNPNDLQNGELKNYKGKRK
jgi:hypothetical protein